MCDSRIKSRELARLLGESEIQVALVARQHHPRCEWEEHHLVRIPGQRARVLQAIERARWLGGQQPARSVRTIHVKPDTALGTDLSDGLEVVEGLVRVQGVDGHKQGRCL